MQLSGRQFYCKASNSFQSVRFAIHCAASGTNSLFSLVYGSIGLQPKVWHKFPSFPLLLLLADNSELKLGWRSARSRQNHSTPLDLNQDASIIIQGFRRTPLHLFFCSERDKKGGRFSLSSVNKIWVGNLRSINSTTFSLVMDFQVWWSNLCS